MFRNSHNPRGSSFHSRNQTSRWRTVFIALMLALTSGSAGQTHPVQAAPAGELVTWRMEVVKPKTRICPGKTVEYRVKVLAKSLITPLVPTSKKPPEWALSGVFIEASSVDKTVGDFVGAVNGKTTAIIGFTSLDLVTAEFYFTAKKPGKTNLYFEGLVDKKDKSSYVSFKVPVTVIPCKVKVKTVVQVDTEPFDWTGISDEAVMTADEAGTFTGSTSMHWVFFNYNVAPCTLSMSAPDSQVDLIGQLDEDGGQFGATETIQPTTVSADWVCPRIGAQSSPDTQMGWTATPLTFKVASSGGVSTETYADPGGSASARIIVIPEEDEAGAFIPGDHEARVGPPSLRWAMLWDEFSSLFGALPALH